jgi:hypothetical protein
MHPLALDGNYRLIAGIILGTIFGFILIKSDLAWRKRLFDIISFNDTSWLSIFLSSMAIGVPLYFVGLKLGLIHTNFRPTYFWPMIMGSLIAGAGIAICRQFPVTAVASLGAGRTYAVWTIAGMLLAIPFVKSVANWLSDTIYKWHTPDFYHTELKGYASLGTVVLWVSLLSLAGAIALHFFLAKSTSSSEDK